MAAAVGATLNRSWPTLAAMLAPRYRETDGQGWPDPVALHRHLHALVVGARVLRRAYAWADANGDPSTKSAYKFIHHEVSAKGDVGPANVRACSSGIAVLNGGRGGADLPASDRKGVYNHLARHMRDAGEDPPDLK